MDQDICYIWTQEVRLLNSITFKASDDAAKNFKFVHREKKFRTLFKRNVQEKKIYPQIHLIF